jgi:hypothetical protein
MSKDIRPAISGEFSDVDLQPDAANEILRPDPLIQETKKARVDINPDDLKNGLAQLVLALVKLVHELLEKQAIRRIERGQLSEDACERIGLALMKQAEQIDRLREAFGLEEKDLNVDLGPLGKVR